VWDDEMSEANGMERLSKGLENTFAVSWPPDALPR
jgi:hypothetical protein